VSDEVIKKWRRRGNVSISSRRRRTRWESNGKGMNTRSVVFPPDLLERETKKNLSLERENLKNKKARKRQALIILWVCMCKEWAKNAGDQEREFLYRNGIVF